jgi:signal peptidase I
MSTQESESLPPSPSRAITPEQRVDALREVNRGSATLSFLAEWARTFIVAVLLFLVVRTFVVEAFKIPSGSMERTLLIGDFLLVNKAVYGADVPFTRLRLPRVHAPQRGDVVVFEWPKDVTKNLVKRLVGLPGDTLQMRDGVLVRNGTRLAESYVSRTDADADPSPEEFHWQQNYLVGTASAAGRDYNPSRNNWGPLVVPQENYFVLGDNRDNSLDSRYWGFVPDSLLKGQPMVIYYSFAPDTLNRFAWLTRIRWNRLGERIR